MPYPKRPIAFILAATDQGTLIVNRFDYAGHEQDSAYGVGFQLLNNASYEDSESSMVLQLLDERRRHFGDGVTVLDVGANIGVFTITWARHMTGWGRIIAVEAQERIFQALCGNIAINNCFNARAIFAAASRQCGEMLVPVPDYRVPSSFGSLELRQSPQTEAIGQPIDYHADGMQTIATVSVDSLNLARLDLLKIDVEGMEIEVLQGALETIIRCHPILVIEHLKVDNAILEDFLRTHGYTIYRVGMNFLAIHPSDPTHANVVVAAE